MTGYKIGMAEEAVIADLTAKLVECQKDRDAWENACLDWENEAIASQAREAKLRDLAQWLSGCCDLTGYSYWEQNRHILAEQLEDTALKEFKRKVLLEAVDGFGDSEDV